MKRDNLNTNGWIKLYRDLLDKPIWLLSTPEQKTILITLLLMANHSQNEWEFKGARQKVEPGQFITSLDSIKEKAGKGISIQNIRTAIKRFENYEFLTSTPTNKNRLITICNWGSYQTEKDETNKQANKQLTSNQQAANKQLTTNKNDKNDKEVLLHKKSIEFKKSIEPYVKEYGKDLCNEFFMYWTEPTVSKKQLRFEKEKTWDVKRRLARWKSNNFNNNGNDKAAITTSRTRQKLD